MDQPDLNNPKVVDHMLREETMDQDGDEASTYRGSTTSGTNQRQLPRIYETTKRARIMAMQVHNLDGSKATAIDCGSFHQEEDRRIELATTKSIFARGQNICSSYDIVKMECNSCQDTTHPVLTRENEDGTTGDSGLQCFILTDQNFPAVIQVAGNGECLKIFRIENATLAELADAFCDMVKGFSIPIGSVVGIGSLSQLVNEGPSSYAVAFRKAVFRLSSKFGEGLRVIHTTPINIFEMEETAILAWVEFGIWITSRAEDYCLSGSMQIWMPKQENTATWSVPARRGLWPTNMANREMATMVIPGVKDLPHRIPPATPKREFDLLTSMIEELNARYGVDLSTDILSVRNPNGSSESIGYEAAYAAPKRIRIVIVGASHASRLAAELADDPEVELVDLAHGGLCVTNSSIENLVADLEAALTTEFSGPTIIVYHVLDNNIFLGKTRSGIHGARRGEDGNMHLEGSLTYLRGRELEDLLAMTTPLLRAGRQHRKILIAPVRRYAANPCCNDPAHVENFKSRDFIPKMVDALADIRDTMRSFYYRKKIQNFRVFSGDKLMGWEEDPSLSRMEEMWGDDPVHLAAASYREMAKQVVEAGESPIPFTNHK